MRLLADDVNNRTHLRPPVENMAVNETHSEDETLTFDDPEEDFEENERFGGQPYRFEPIGRIQRPQRAPAIQNQRS